MSIAFILILITTLAGLLTLWQDELTKVSPTTPSGETDSEKAKRLTDNLKDEKTKRIKLISTVFVLLTLLFTIFQIITDRRDARAISLAKVNQHRLDSARYSTDSLKHVFEWKQDSTAHAAIDSIRLIQTKAYLVQILAGKTMDSLKIKSLAIINGLHGVDAAISYNINKIDKSTADAGKAFSQLIRSTQRQLYLLTDDISMRFDFGFWSPKTEKTIADYLKAHNITNEYVHVDESFPFYNQIQEVMKDASLEVEFFDNNDKSKIINGSNHKMKDIIGVPTMMYLENRDPLILIPYHDEKGPNPHLLYYRVLPKSAFEMNYHVPSKSFFFTCADLPLKITQRQDEFLSIVDYDKSAVLVTLKTPEVRDNKNCFFNLDSSYTEFSIDFSHKGSSYTYDNIYPLNFYGTDIWPEYFIDTLKINYKN